MRSGTAPGVARGRCGTGEEGASRGRVLAGGGSSGRRRRGRRRRPGDGRGSFAPAQRSASRRAVSKPLGPWGARGRRRRRRRPREGGSRARARTLGRAPARPAPAPADSCSWARAVRSGRSGLGPSALRPPPARTPSPPRLYPSYPVRGADRFATARLSPRVQLLFPISAPT
jgi:hypothetical protein